MAVSPEIKIKFFIIATCFNLLWQPDAALKVITTFPITVNISERSFSKLKLIKTYLRSTMGQERLTGLVLISIEHEESRKVDTSDLIEKFARRKSRKRRFTA